MGVVKPSGQRRDNRRTPASGEKSVWRCVEGGIRKVACPPPFMKAQVTTSSLGQTNQGWRQSPWADTVARVVESVVCGSAGQKVYEGFLDLPDYCRVLLAALSERIGLLEEGAARQEAIRAACSAPGDYDEYVLRAAAEGAAAAHMEAARLGCFLSRAREYAARVESQLGVRRNG